MILLNHIKSSVILLKKIIEYTRMLIKERSIEYYVTEKQKSDG